MGASGTAVFQQVSAHFNCGIRGNFRYLDIFRWSIYTCKAFANNAKFEYREKHK
ncbi:hypothetical protein AVEN_82234-1, partial [Araneus ventricosus]